MSLHFMQAWQSGRLARPTTLMASLGAAAAAALLLAQSTNAGPVKVVAHRPIGKAIGPRALHTGCTPSVHAKAAGRGCRMLRRVNSFRRASPSRRSSIANAPGEIQICPDSSYMGGGACFAAPNGKYMAGPPQRAPDGSYVGGSPTLAPNGKYVGGPPARCPDGTYVGGRKCVLAPNGRYVGVP